MANTSSGSGSVPHLVLPDRSPSSDGLLARRNRRKPLPRITLASLALLPCTCALGSASPLPSPAMTPSPRSRLGPAPWLDLTALQVQPFEHHLDRRQSSASTINYPEPFDTSLSPANFTSLSCPSFIQTFISEPDFQSCHPFSFLLGTSNAFFTSYSNAAPSSSSAASFVTTPTSANAATLRQTLDASCAADVADCTAVMNTLASEFQQSNRCGQDLKAGNAVAVEAFQGFQNYPMMRDAACLKSNTTMSFSRNSTSSASSSSAAAPSSSSSSTSSSGNASTSPRSLEARGVTQQYCFEQAVASTDPDDLYFWYLPEGISLPSGTKPTCDACTNALMDIYVSWASNSSLSVYSVYPLARTVVNARCGPSFAALPPLNSTSSAWPLLRRATGDSVALTVLLSVLLGVLVSSGGLL